MPSERKKEIPALAFTDTQISTVADLYYGDENFSRKGSDAISLWKLYNLFTSANKSSYIDKFMPRGANAFDFINQIVETLDSGEDNWFMN